MNDSGVAGGAGGGAMTPERRDITPRGQAIREIIGEALADGMLWHRPEGALEGSCGSIYVILARAFALGEAHGIEVTTAETRALLPKEDVT